MHPQPLVATYVTQAVHGFICSLATSEPSQQDALRLLKLCLAYGHLPEVHAVMTLGE